MRIKSEFIVWASGSRRAKSLAAELEGKISFHYESSLKGYWLTPLRYLVQGWKTLHFLEVTQPEFVIVQAPPIVAPLCVAAWCKLRSRSTASGRRVHIPYAIDCHTGTFYGRSWRWTLPLLCLLSKEAVVTLVASEGAFKTLQNWKTRCILLVDGLPNLGSPTGTVGSEGEARVAVISSFDTDEPIAELFAAARLLPHVTFYFSGNAKRVPIKLLEQKPENAILTGFLKDSDYTGLLQNVHGLVILTTDPNTLNCGSYEALVMAKPAVISDWPQMRRYFTHGFIYVNNTAQAIATGVQKMLDEREMLTIEVIAMRSVLMAKRQPAFEELVALMEGNRVNEHEVIHKEQYIRY